MKLTRERKIYAAVLVLALGALGAEQMLGSGGADAGDASAEYALTSAAATPAPAGRAIAQKSSSAGQASGNIAGSARSITQLLETIRDTRDVQLDGTPDVFSRSQGQADHVSTHEEVRTRSLIEQFSRHRLTSVIAGGRGGDSAMVDGKLIRVGQTFDRFKLIAVDSQSALFEGERGIRMRLSLGGENRAVASSAGQ